MKKIILIILICFNNMVFAENKQASEQIIITEQNFQLVEDDFNQCINSDSMNDCLNEKQDSKQLMKLVVDESLNKCTECDIYDD